jgi:hypothetical protein
MLAIAFAKISLPGCMNLSPGCRPEIDNTIVVSRCLIPTMATSAIVYSLGILAVCHSNNFGSTEVGFVVSSCACAVSTEAIISINKALCRSEDRCMVCCSSQSYSAIGETAISLLCIYKKPPNFCCGGKLTVNIESVC